MKKSNLHFYKTTKKIASYFFQSLFKSAQIHNYLCKCFIFITAFFPIKINTCILLCVNKYAFEVK